MAGHVRPEDLVFCAGIKSSIRSDRVYQLLFEANAWKYLFRKVFDAPPSKYIALVTENYGTRSNKLYSVDFSSCHLAGERYERVIDGDFNVTTPDDLTQWFANA